jgi:hypothetical protein
MEGWRKIHNEDLYDLEKEKELRVAHVGEMRSAYKMLIGRSEGNRPIGRSGF